MSRWWTVGAVAAALLISFVLFREFWSPDVFLAGYDTYTHDYLMWEWGWKTLLSTHQVPLWNPYLFGGWPFVASFAFCPFYPPAWISVVFPTSLAITIQYALHIALGAIGFYAFCRAIGLSGGTSFLVSLLYEAGGHVATLAFPGHLAKVQAIAWLPWAMAAAAMLVRNPKVVWVLALAGAGAMQLLASHTQIFYATFALVVVFTIYCVLFATRDGDGKHKMKIAGAFTMALVLAMALSAVQMFPALEMAGQSNRAGGLDLKTAPLGALPAGEIPEVVLPSFRGDSTGKLKLGNTSLPYIGSWNAPDGKRGERLVSDYVGAWPFLFALGALLWSRRREKWFFLIAAIGAVLISVGMATPVFKWAFRLIPGFSRFRSPATFMVVFNFAVFALAALGLEASITRVRFCRNGRGNLLVTALISLGLASAVGLLAVRYQLHHAAGSFPSGAVVNLPLILFLRSANHVLLFLCLGGAALLLAIVWGAFDGGTYRSWRRYAQFGLLGVFVIIAIADGMSQIGHFFPKDQTSNLENYLYGHWTDTAILRDADGAVLPAMLESGRELNNRSMLRAIRSIHGYHPVVYGAYEKLVAAAGGFDSPVLARLFAQNYRVIPADASVPAGWLPLMEMQGRRVICREQAIPFARVPQRVDPLGKNWDALSLKEWRQAIGQPDFDPLKRSICEGEYQWAADSAGAQAKTWAVDASLSKPGEIRLKLASTPAAALVEREKIAPETQSDGFVPCLLPVLAGSGWRVWIEKSRPLSDGPSRERIREEVSPIWPRRANGFFLLVPLSPSAQAQTVVSYAPASFFLGAIISCISLLGAVLFLLLVRFPYFRKK